MFTGLVRVYGWNVTGAPNETFRSRFDSLDLRAEMNSLSERKSLLSHHTG
jgi:hypothetical protein